MSKDTQALAALRGVLAYALREICLIESAPDAAIKAIAAAYNEVDSALANDTGAASVHADIAPDVSQLN